MSALRALLARLSRTPVARADSYGGSIPSKSANRQRKLSALIIGLACAVYPPAEDPYPAEEACYEQSRFVRSSHSEYARERFVGAGAHADVAVVVVTYNSASDIAPLIDDLRVAAIDRPLRVVVVDNQSSDGTADIVRARTDVRLIESKENLGYASGINAGLPFTEPCDAVLILNPDIALAHDAVTRLLMAADAHRIGAVVPLMLYADGATFPSLRREPSLTRAIGDALLGRKIRGRPGFSSETDSRLTSYIEAHDVHWATGAALLIPAAVAREVGAWNEEFLLYSEETDYFRRIRESGRRVRFEPSAVVKHRGQGSGISPELATLMAVNRVRYVERHHGRVYSLLFRAAVALAEGLRSYDAAHRRTLDFVLHRRRWQELSL
jgi:GT2 family glycosyltransferase